MDASAVSAVVLAAGRGSRMGGGKMLSLLEGRPLILHVLEPLLALGLGEIIVVTGHEGEAVEAVLPPATRAVRCERFAEGMGTSLACGVKACRAQAGGLLVVLGDMPRVPLEHYRSLLAAGGEIAATRSADYFGPPALFAAAMRTALEALSGDTGAKPLLGKGVQYVAAQPDWVEDIDDPIERA